MSERESLFSFANQRLNSFVRDKEPGQWIAFAYEEAAELIADFDRLCLLLDSQPEKGENREP